MDPCKPWLNKYHEIQAAHDAYLKMHYEPWQFGSREVMELSRLTTPTLRKLVLDYKLGILKGNNVHQLRAMIHGKVSFEVMRERYMQQSGYISRRNKHHAQECMACTSPDDRRKRIEPCSKWIRQDRMYWEDRFKDSKIVAWELGSEEWCLLNHMERSRMYNHICRLKLVPSEGNSLNEQEMRDILKGHLSLDTLRNEVHSQESYKEHLKRRHFAHCEYCKGDDEEEDMLSLPEDIKDLF